MTSIRKAKKAFKRNPYYKGKKVKTFVWRKAILENKTNHMFTSWRFLYKKQGFNKNVLMVKVCNVGFMDLKRYKQNLVL